MVAEYRVVNATWRMPLMKRTTVGWQIICLLIGLAASLIPGLPRTHPFWGCHRAWNSLAANRVTINDVLADSPASAAGLKDGDRVISIDGQLLNRFYLGDQMIQRLQPGQEVQLEVERGADKARLIAEGFVPEQEAILYYQWQLAYAGGCVILLVLLSATQPLRPLVSIWRPILLILTGLGTTAALLLTDWHSIWSAMLFHRRWPVDNLVYPWIQVSVCLAVAICMVGFVTWEIRGTIEKSQKPGENNQGGVPLSQENKSRLADH